LYFLRDAFSESRYPQRERVMTRAVHEPSSIRIIGLGNEFRGDDAVGLMAARRLRQVIGDRAEVIEAELAGIDLMELIKEARVVILIDAARSGQAAGTIYRFDASADPIGGQLFAHSSHAIGLSEALELARALGTLPATVIVYGVEVGNVEAGRPLSPPAANALAEVVERIVQECEACHA
jgi:hydrogenase maturation protease